MELEIPLLYELSIVLLMCEKSSFCI